MIFVIECQELDQDCISCNGPPGNDAKPLLLPCLSAMAVVQLSTCKQVSGVPTIVMLQQG